MLIIKRWINPALTVALGCMKIDLTNIPPEGKNIRFEFPCEWWYQDSERDQILGTESPVSGWISVRPAGKKIAVEGFVSTKLRLRCDRCLESYGLDLGKDFRVFVSFVPPKGTSEIELAEDDLDLDFIKGRFLDIDQVVREQLITSLPMKALCAEGCKGLCPLCGCNLNKERCSCSPEHESP